MPVAPEAVTKVMVIASVSFRAQPHKRAEILSAVDDTIERMRQAAGCTRCRLLVDTEDPNAFTMWSEWQSTGAADAFFDSREFQMFKGIRILLRDEPMMTLDDVQSRVTRLIRGK
jgi:quinol monooxygenase YgiN